MQDSLFMANSRPLEDELEALTVAKPKPLIKRNKHPSLPLSIYNYTVTAQWRKHWTPLTMMSRGLILEQGSSKIIARPMPKFHNHSEKLHATPDSDEFVVLEKVDGSLGIWFFYDGKWYMATRGSFDSHQAEEGQVMANALDLPRQCDPSKTYCFEIIYPKQQHVVRYGARRELVLLAVIDTISGFDLPSDQLPGIAEKLGTSVVRTFSLSNLSFDQMAELNTENEEGFVIRFTTSGERLKVKFSTYLLKTRPGLAAPKKARIKGFVPNFVAKVLFNDPDDRIENHLDALPDEFFEEARAFQTSMLELIYKKECQFDAQVEKLKAVQMKDIDRGIVGHNLICKWLRLSRSESPPREEMAKSRAQYVMTMARKDLEQ